jgi:glycosyltransferase involved in cell wall biosynthesis
VQPDVGSFRELVEATGGGVLYDPKEAGGLTRALAGLLADPARRTALGTRGRESVVRSYGLDTMATMLLDVYRRAVSDRRVG